jgi:hypothetical protein
VIDLVWVLVPLWLLASQELARHLPQGEISPASLGQATLIFILLALFWITLAGLSHLTPGAADTGIRIGVMVGIIALSVLTTVLVALGWSWDVARKGLAWGWVVVLGIYGLSTLWGAAQLRPNQTYELWRTPPVTGQASLLLRTLGDLSEWHTGFRNTIDVVVSADSASFRWVLRDFPHARFVSEPEVGDLPAVIITRQEQDEPSLTASYRGQDFVWWIRPGWSGALPDNTAQWLVFRQAPLQTEYVILWARSDLFPGGTLEQQGN